MISIEQQNRLEAKITVLKSDLKGTRVLAWTFLSTTLISTISLVLMAMDII